MFAGVRGRGCEVEDFERGLHLCSMLFGKTANGLSVVVTRQGGGLLRIIILAFVVRISSGFDMESSAACEGRTGVQSPEI